MAVVARYIREGSLGDGSGTSWSNAADLSRFDDMCYAAGPDGYVFLRAGDDFRVDDSYTMQALQTEVGTLTAPLRIRGAKADNTPGRAILTSDRQSLYDGTVRTSSTDGKTGIDLRTSHTFISWLGFKRFGLGCIRFNKTGTQTNNRIWNIRGENIRSLITDDEDAIIENAYFGNIVGRGYSRGFMRLQGPNHGILMENLRGYSMHQTEDSFPAGIQFVGDNTLGGTENTLLRNCSMRDAWHYIADDFDEYYNADGFSSEWTDNNIVFENCHAWGNTDAGFDLKSTNTTLKNCSAGHNNRNFRFWSGSIEATKCRSYRPQRADENGNAHVWSGRNTDGDSKWIDGFIDARGSTATAFHLEGGDNFAGVNMGGGLEVVNGIVRQPSGALYRKDEGSGTHRLTETGTVIKEVTTEWTP